MLFILPGLWGLPLQLHNKVFKFNSMKNKRILFQVFSIQKITDRLSSNHYLSCPYIQTLHITSVQCCRGCSVHWRLFSTLGDNISTVGDSFSTVGDSFSTVEVVQYSGDNISTCRGITSVLWGITSVLWGITSVLWRVFSIVEGYLQYRGG